MDSGPMQSLAESEPGQAEQGGLHPFAAIGCSASTGMPPESLPSVSY